ncbi:mucin-associated surface protein (MASP) [Trypanosoma cruzi]|nr:mucin-associated surface protein (MASP) [Trypanosoma cruzi]
MAMMMADRVLLVCALCVLWCVVGCGFADKVVGVPAGVVASNRTDEENLILNWYFLMREECANESTTGGKFNVTAERICIHKVMKGVCDAFYDKTSGVTHDRDVEFICTYYATIPEDPSNPQHRKSHNQIQLSAIPQVMRGRRRMHRNSMLQGEKEKKMTRSTTIRRKKQSKPPL